MTWAPCLGADKPVTLGFLAKVDFGNGAYFLEKGKPKSSKNFSDLEEEWIVNKNSLFLRVSWIFSVLANWFSIFKCPEKYAFTFGWFVNQRLLQQNFFFYFFGDVNVIKARKLHQTRVNPAHMKRLRVDNWEQTTVTVSREGLGSTIQPHLPKVAVYPPCHVENYLQFLLIFNIVLGGEGKSRVFLKLKAALFWNFSRKPQSNYWMKPE